MYLKYHLKPSAGSYHAIFYISYEAYKWGFCYYSSKSTKLSILLFPQLFCWKALLSVLEACTAQGDRKKHGEICSFKSVKKLQWGTCLFHSQLQAVSLETGGVLQNVNTNFPFTLLSFGVVYSLPFYAVVFYLIYIKMYLNHLVYSQQ